MEKIKKEDFIEVDYVGRVKDNNSIFDITNEEKAKKEGIYNENMEYGPVVVCVGQKNTIKGLDESFEGRNIGEKYNLDIKPEDGFGKKDSKLIKLVNANIFKDNDIRPVPGLRVNIDGTIGTIRTVSGGRISIDFNHPLAGKELLYEVTIVKKVNDSKEKVKACMKFVGLKEDMFEIKKREGDKFEIDIKQSFPDQLKKAFESKIKELVPEIKSIEIKTTQE